MVKPGYKQTEVGVIPEDWEAETLGKLTVLMTNGFVGTATRHYTDEGKGVRYIHGYNVIANSFDFHGVKFVDESFHRAHLKSCLRAGDVLTVQTGDVGLTTVVNDELAGSNCHALIISRFDQKKACPKFISFYLNSGQGRSRLKLIEIGTTMKHLNVGDMLQFSVPLPPTLSEQQAIATALSDTDELIESLEQLLTKKRQIKQGAMQELLTGKKRLPGFSGKWEVKRLEGILETPVTDGPHLTPQFLDQGIPFLSVNNLVGNRIDLSELRFISQKDHEEFSKKCKPHKGDILLGKAASVGKVARVTLDIEFNIWSPIAMIRVNKGNSSAFVYYQLQSAALIRQITLLTNSSSQGNIGMGDIEKLTLRLPSLPEQNAIAEVLSDMDAEIEALESKLTKARHIKQGMMQELLTGRIRLV